MKNLFLSFFKKASCLGLLLLSLCWTSQAQANYLHYLVLHVIPSALPHLQEHLVALVSNAPESSLNERSCGHNDRTVKEEVEYQIAGRKSSSNPIPSSLEALLEQLREPVHAERKPAYPVQEILGEHVLELRSSTGMCARVILIGEVAHSGILAGTRVDSHYNALLDEMTAAVNTKVFIEVPKDTPTPWHLRSQMPELCAGMEVEYLLHLALIDGASFNYVTDQERRNRSLSAPTEGILGRIDSMKGNSLRARKSLLPLERINNSVNELSADLLVRNQVSLDPAAFFEYVPATGDATAVTLYVPNKSETMRYLAGRDLRPDINSWRDAVMAASLHWSVVVENELQWVACESPVRQVSAYAVMGSGHVRGVLEYLKILGWHYSQDRRVY